MPRIEPAHKVLACLFLICVSAIAVNSWTLNSAHFFYADDWSWLRRAAFGKWSDVFNIFPSAIYNDRPGGELFIRIMYKSFGLNSHPYNVLWLLLHVLNCILFFAIALSALPLNRALVASLLAASWYSSLLAVHWVGAIFDLVGATWCLLCLLFYLRSSHASRWSSLLLVGALVAQVLAIRTKEFALALVMVLIAWELLIIENQKLSRRILRLAPFLLVTFLYGLLYSRLYEAHRSFVNSGVYQLALSPASALANAAYYCAQAFYVPPAWGVRAGMYAGYVLLAIVVFLGFTSKRAMAALIAATALMAAVLLMTEQKNILYIYAPHFFLALMLCAVLPRSKVATAVTWAFAGILIAVPFYTHEWKWSRDFYLAEGRYSEQLFSDYVRLMGDKPTPTELTIGVSRPYFDPFSSGAGNALRIYYNNPQIRVNVVKVSAPDDDVCAKTMGVCLVERSGHLIPVRAPM